MTVARDAKNGTNRMAATDAKRLNDVPYHPLAGKELEESNRVPAQCRRPNTIILIQSIANCI